MLRSKLILILSTLAYFASQNVAFSMGRKDETPAPDFTLGQISVGGTGCKQGDAQIELSKDSREVTIRFSKLAVQAGGTGGAALDRKNCSIAIPVEFLPAGFRLQITEVTLNGTYEVASGSKIHLAHETFLAGTTGDKIDLDFNTEKSTSTPIRVVEPALASTGCSDPGILRTSTSLVAQASGGAGVAQVDDLSLKFKLEACN